MRLTSVVLVFAIGSAGCGRHQEQPYSDLERRPVKALSSDQVAGYLSGEGMGLALAAELNGYPGPRHVLGLAGQLELSDQQRRATEEIFRTMQAEARRSGALLVAKEQQLDHLFASRRADQQAVGRLTSEIGGLAGQVRNAHLRAHLEMLRILTPEQVARYRQLRGYGAKTAHDPPRHSGR